MHNSRSQARQPVLARVRFYGHLRARFGDGHRLAVRTPAAAVKALCHRLPGFERYMRDHNQPGYRVLVDETPIECDQGLHEPAVGKTISIVPVVAGAAGGGKILAGIALIGLSFVPGLNVAVWASASTTFASLAMNIGISMALGGLSQMIAGNPSQPAPVEAANNQPSYAFNGAVNTTAQGNPVPILYGMLEIGSQVISAGLEASELAGATTSIVQLLVAKT